MAMQIIHSITKPVKEVSVALKCFSMGKLDIPVTYNSRSELGGMCDALRKSQHVLTELISDECNILEEMASGNFDVRTKDESIYVGALSDILKSIRSINGNLSNTLGQIMYSAGQVANEAMQVSNGSQSLAQGSTEQASSVEQLASTIAEISNNAKNNAHNSEQASNQSKLAGGQVAESVKLMEDMVVAMQNISDSSNEIGKIIATIENIEIINLEAQEEKDISIHSLSIASTIEFEWEESTFKYEEYLPISLKESTNHYQLEKMVLTDAIINQSQTKIYNDGDKNVVFY